jgi:septal ring factor EnvC (AmiA/AmiB activator)
MTRTTSVLLLSCIVIASLLVGASAAPSPAPPAVGVLTAVAAQASPSPKEAPAASGTATTAERITSLEKENVILREDLGKARLDTRTQIETASKRQAEAVARLQKQLDEANAKMESERQKNAKRSRNLWYAIGALAVGIVATR